MALQITAICNSIAGLTVSGVTIKDLDEIPEAQQASAAIIIPRPDGFVSGFSIERDSQGSNTVGLPRYTVGYNLTYRLLYSPLGVERGLFKLYPSAVAAAFRFVDAVTANDAVTGALDIQVADIQNVGPVADPSGAMFHGCDIIVRVTELVN